MGLSRGCKVFFVFHLELVVNYLCTLSIDETKLYLSQVELQLKLKSDENESSTYFANNRSRSDECIN